MLGEERFEMRRSGSSSCLLRPKHSLSTDDLAAAAAAGTPTATILTREKSVTACAQDRLHLLAELQSHAHSIHFLESDDLIRGADLPPSVILYLEVGALEVSTLDPEMHIYVCPCARFRTLTFTPNSGIQGSAVQKTSPMER